MGNQNATCCRVLQDSRGMARQQAEAWAAGLTEHEVHAIADLAKTPNRGEALKAILDAIADRQAAENEAKQKAEKPEKEAAKVKKARGE